MPRPRMIRCVRGTPGAQHYKPIGVPGFSLDYVILTMEEFETIRLVDYEELSQIEAAKKMSVSQPTFQRIYKTARKKIADAFVNGKGLKIEGGHFRFVDGQLRGFIGNRGRGPRGR